MEGRGRGGGPGGAGRVACCRLANLITVVGWRSLLVVGWQSLIVVGWRSLLLWVGRAYSWILAVSMDVTSLGWRGQISERMDGDVTVMISVLLHLKGETF